MKTIRAFMAVAAVAAFAFPVSGQQAGGSGNSQGSGTGQNTTTVQGRMPAPPPAAVSRGGQAVNVKLDIAILDHSAGQPVKKQLSMLIADMGSGRVRSTGTLTQEFVVPGMQSPDGKPLVQLRPIGDVSLNVDANVQLITEDKIRTGITLEYTPASDKPLPQGASVTWSPLNQTVTVILTNGKPLVITQSADPLSERKVTVEVTATILR